MSNATNIENSCFPENLFKLVYHALGVIMIAVWSRSTKLYLQKKLIFQFTDVELNAATALLLFRVCTV